MCVCVCVLERSAVLVGSCGCVCVLCTYVSIYVYVRVCDGVYVYVYRGARFCVCGFTHYYTGQYVQSRTRLLLHRKQSSVHYMKMSG